MQFLVIAHDGADEGAPARRAAARESHLQNIAPMVKDGRIIVGGATLDDKGVPDGSYVVCDFADRAALDAWLTTDPYTVGGVWQRFEVRAIRVAVKG